MRKDFSGWCKLKEKLNSLDKPATFQQQEVWWCSVGVNIGHEVDGKSELYSRPVLVLKKFNQHIFYGIPLTTQIKENPFYYKVTFKQKKQCVMLSQMRLWESRRMTRRMGKMSDADFKNVRNALKNIL